MKIALETLGCKLNQAETEELARTLAGAGHEVVSRVEDADLYILNTCTVTATADRKSRNLLRRARRRNPGVAVVAAGCYADRAADILARIEGVALIVKNTDKPELTDLLRETGFLKESLTEPSGTFSGVELNGRTRSFIRIQDGCNNFCSYCIVPLVRGREKSRPAGEVLDDIRQRISDGFREVVLTGTEIGAYHEGGTGLGDLIRRILDETAVDRLRLSSLQPGEVTPELIRLWKDERLCPHFHLALQSGSDTVLKRMNRRYTTSDFRKAVRLIRETVPDAAITTDIIVGFPGETEEESEETVAFCRETGFARMHVFPYSSRPGTAAEKMADKVPDADKRRRNEKLQALAAESTLAYRKLFTGRTMSVLWEQRSGGYWTGLTGNYLKVYAKSGRQLANTITDATLGEPFRDGIEGNISG